MSRLQNLDIRPGNDTAVFNGSASSSGAGKDRGQSATSSQPLQMDSQRTKMDAGDGSGDSAGGAKGGESGTGDFGRGKKPGNDRSNLMISRAANLVLLGGLGYVGKEYYDASSEKDRVDALRQLAAQEAQKYSANSICNSIDRYCDGSSVSRKLARVQRGAARTKKILDGLQHEVP